MLCYVVTEGNMVIEVKDRWKDITFKYDIVGHPITKVSDNIWTAGEYTITRVEII